MSHTESIEKNRIRFLNLFNLSNGVEHITLIVTYNIIFYFSATLCRTGTRSI